MSADSPPPAGRRPRSGDVSCRYCIDRVSDYVDGSLAQDEYHRVRRHLAGCRDCEREVQLEHEVRRGIRDVEPPATPLALADRLVSIGEGGDTVWLRPGGDELPSTRAVHRRLAQAGIGTMVMVLAMVVAVGWLMGPALPSIDNLDAAAVGEAGAVVPTPASTGEQADPVVTASSRMTATGATASSAQLVTVSDAHDSAAVSSDAAHLLLDSWPTTDDVAATVCLAAGRCLQGLVHGTVGALALTLFAADGAPAQSVAWTPLVALPRGVQWRFLGAGTLAGVAVAGLEARSASGVVLRRWWLSTQDLHLVQVDSFRDGSLVATEAFRPGSSVGVLDCPREFVCPDQVAGLPLVNVARDVPEGTQQVRLLFADDRGSVVVVEQRGRLARESGTARVSGRAQVWQAGALVMAAAGTDATLVAGASAALPHHAAPASPTLRRIELGLRRIGRG